MRRRHRAWLRGVLFAVAALSTLAMTAAGGGLVYLNHTLDKIKRVEVPTLVPVTTEHPGQTAAQAPFTVLIVGTDSRDGTGSAYGGAAAACQCSDSMILARLDPETRKMSLLALPRDTLVDRVDEPGKKSKLNETFAKGQDVLIKQISATFHIPINHYAMIDLAGFTKVVDALGGVRLDFPMQVHDGDPYANPPQPSSGLDVTTTGCRSVDGTTALQVTRARKLYYKNSAGKWVADPTWDDGRSRRQMMFLRVLGQKALSQGLADPLTGLSVLGAVTPNVEVDSGLNNGDLLSIAEGFRGFDPQTIPIFTLPTIDDPGSPWGWVQRIDPQKDADTIRAWYSAVQAPAPSSSPSSSSSSVSSATGGGPAGQSTSSASSAPGSAGSSSAPPSSASSPAAAPIDPYPWDPRPC